AKCERIIIVPSGDLFAEDWSNLLQSYSLSFIPMAESLVPLMKIRKLAKGSFGHLVDESWVKSSGVRSANQGRDYRQFKFADTALDPANIAKYNLFHV